MTIFQGGALLGQQKLVKPGDLEYRGAFRLPDGPDEIGWTWCGESMTYYPKGDQRTEVDGYPGSLFGAGHNWNQHISEISIPGPVISKTKNVKDLPTAQTLQKFSNIKGGLFKEIEQPRTGLAYLPKQGDQKTDKLYFCWAPHLDEGSKQPAHGMCELDLSNPKSTGLWAIGREDNYVTTDYIFDIPQKWAEKHAQGMMLATGRFRDGGQSSFGPSLFAYAPWQSGNPPAKGSSVKAVTLLKYTKITDEKHHKIKDYHHSDHWAGGVWMTAGKKAAVAFIGTKGTGKCWYGFANGVVWPHDGPFPPVPAAPNDQRGWWSTEFVGQIVFYNPDDLAAVAAGKVKPHEPQPYAKLDIDKYLFADKTRKQSLVGASAFDRTNGLLYVFEPLADEDKSIVHVWKVN